MSVLKAAGSFDWKYALREVSLIVIGVSIALAASAWYQGRTDRQDEQAFLGRLHAEVELAETLTARLRDRRLASHQLLIAAADVLFGRVERLELSERECSAIGTSIFFNFSASGLPSVTELVSTGRVAIMRDAELRSALVGLHQTREVLALLISVQASNAIDLPFMFPELIRLESWVDPDMGEVRSNYSCDTAGMRASQVFLNSFSENNDRYDAYVRDGLLPWIRQIDAVHDRVDSALDIQHDRQNRADR